MGTISVSLPADGTGADVTDYNTPITTIVNTINGNLDSNNLAANAVTAAKIADATITAGKTAFGGNYSTSEVDTGFTWVDGKHVYKKTVSCGGLPNNTTKNTAHGISNIQTVIQISGVTYTALGGTQYPIPLITSTSRAEIAVSSTNIIIVTNTDLTVFANTYITLLYTRN